MVSSDSGRCELLGGGGGGGVGGCASVGPLRACVPLLRVFSKKNARGGANIAWMIVSEWVTAIDA